MSDRPKQVRAIFLVTMFKLILAWTMCLVLSLKGHELATVVLYTASAYTALAMATFVFIHKKNLIAVRVCIGLALIASIPAKAFIGIAIDLAAMVLTFTKPAIAHLGGGAARSARA